MSTTLRDPHISLSRIRFPHTRAHLVKAIKVLYDLNSWEMFDNRAPRCLVIHRIIHASSLVIGRDHQILYEYLVGH